MFLFSFNCLHFRILFSTNYFPVYNSKIFSNSDLISKSFSNSNFSEIHNSPPFLMCKLICPTSISLCQTKYYLDLLSNISLIGYKPIKTSANPSIKMFHNDIFAFNDISTYIRLIGWLLYLTTTRSDITFITQQLN